MKIVGTGKKTTRRGISIRLEESVLAEINKLQSKSNIARQRLIEEILKEAFKDPNFHLDLSEVPRIKERKKRKRKR